MAKRDLPMMPWFPKDFLAATRGWSVTAKGVYRELLDVQWEEGSLPDDQEELRALIGATPEEWAIGWAKAQRKFTQVEPGKIQDLLLESRREKALELAEKKSRGARTTNALRYGQRSLIDTDSDSHSDTDSESDSGSESDTDSGVNGRTANAERDAERDAERSHPSPYQTKVRSTDISGVTAQTLAEHLFEVWKVVYNHPRAKLDDKRKKKIQAALKLGYSVPELERAIKGYKHSPHHMGENDSRTVFDDIELFLRDAKHIDAGLKYAERAGLGGNGGSGPAEDDPWSRGPSRGVHS